MLIYITRDLPWQKKRPMMILWSLILLAVLSVLARLTDDDVRRATAESLPALLRQAHKDGDLDPALGLLCRLYPLESDLKRMLSRVDPPTALLLTLNDQELQAIQYYDATVRAFLCLPSTAYTQIHPRYVSYLIHNHAYPFESYANFPDAWFVDSQFVDSLMGNFGMVEEDMRRRNPVDHRLDPQRKSDSKIRYSKTRARAFFLSMTPAQFGQIMKGCPQFHDGELDGESLNILAVNKPNANEYLGKVTGAFLDGINKGGRSEEIRLSEAVIQGLPTDILNKVTVPFNPADSHFFTTEQLLALDHRTSLIKHDMRNVPQGRLQQLGKKQLFAGKNYSPKQLSMLAGTQWNELLSEEQGYLMLVEGVTIRDVERVKLTPKWFPLAHPSVQAWIITHHPSPPNDLLAFIQSADVRGWSYRSVAGLEILLHAPNTKLLSCLGQGESVPHAKHPLAGVKPGQLQRLVHLTTDLNETALSLMDIPVPKSLEGLRRDAEFVCFLSDIHDIIDDIRVTSSSSRSSSSRHHGDSSHRQHHSHHGHHHGRRSSSNGSGGGSHQHTSRRGSSAWAELTSDDIKRLFSRPYSKLAKQMKASSLSQLRPSALQAIPPASLLQMSCLKDVDPAVLALLPDAFFRLLGREHVNLVPFGKLTKSQLALLPASFMAALDVESVTGRIGDLAAAQLAALPPALLATIDPALIKAASMTLLKAGHIQVMNVARLSPAQIAVIGTAHEDGATVNAVLAQLTTMKDRLEPASKAALSVRQPAPITAAPVSAPPVTQQPQQQSSQQPQQPAEDQSKAAGQQSGVGISPLVKYSIIGLSVIIGIIVICIAAFIIFRKPKEDLE